MCKSCKKNKLEVTNLAQKYGTFEKKDMYIYFFNNAWRYAAKEFIPETATRIELVYKHE